MLLEDVLCSQCGNRNPTGVKFCATCGYPLTAPPSPTPAPVALSHVEGQAVIIGDHARQQISYYGDIIVRVDSP